MTMDIKTFCNFAIQVLAIFGPIMKLSGPLQEKIADLLLAVRDSPLFVEWLQSLFTRTPELPPNAQTLAMAIEPADTELQAAWNASPLLHRWAKDHGGPANLPPGSEGLGIGGIAALIKFIPVLIQVAKMAQQFMPLIQQMIDAFKGADVAPATPSTT